MKFLESISQGVVQGGTTSHPQLPQGLREFVAIAGEILAKNGLVRKSHEKDFIVLVNLADESIHGIDSGSNLPFHAAAGIQDDANAYGNVLVLAEVRNFLGNAVFLDNKIFGAQVSNVMAVTVRYGRNDIHKPDVNAHLRGHECSDRQDCQDRGYW
jgi:hypothetical protein